MVLYYNILQIRVTCHKFKTIIFCKSSWTFQSCLIKLLGMFTLSMTSHIVKCKVGNIMSLIFHCRLTSKRMQ